MPTKLRQVLNAFEAADQPCTLGQLARELDVSPGVLDGMIQHWVRRGKLRPTHGASACNTCGGATECPFIMQMPPTYELVTGDDPEPDPDDVPACISCCG
jgi:hypothetical protein